MLRGRALKLRCKSCQHVITAQAAAPAEPQSQSLPWNLSDGLTGAPAAPTPWFAMLKGKQVGPLAAADLAAKFRSAEATARTFVWREGMTDWRRAAEVAEVAALLPQAASIAANSPPGANPPGEEQSAGLAWLHARTEFFGEPESTPLQVASRPLPELKLPARNGAAADSSTPRESANRVANRSALSEPDASASPGEATRYFIAEAGMNQRNPPWKIAGFALALVAVPAAVLYLLSLLKIGPLVVTRVDAEGHQVRESVFSPRATGIRDLLLGRGRDSAGSKPSPARSSPAKAAASPKAAEASPAPKSASSPELKAFYGDRSHRDVGPTARPAEKSSESREGGLGEGEVAKVVAQMQPAFQFCIEQEMKKNPAFKGGKIFIRATVGSSGTVKHASIDRADVDASTLGECLKGKARRMIFSAFAGEDAELQIPLILTRSL